MRIQSNLLRSQPAERPGFYVEGRGFPRLRRRVAAAFAAGCAWTSGRATSKAQRAVGTQSCGLLTSAFVCTSYGPRADAVVIHSKANSGAGRLKGPGNV